MMTNEFLEAMHDLGRAITNEKYRLNELAASLDDVGMEKLADRVAANIVSVEAAYERMRDLFTRDQIDELRENEKAAGEMLIALLKRAEEHA